MGGNEIFRGEICGRSMDFVEDLISMEKLYGRFMEIRFGRSMGCFGSCEEIFMNSLDRLWSGVTIFFGAENQKVTGQM